MVTLDQTVENVGKLKGDLEAGRRDYERAKQGKVLLEEWMPKFKGALKAETGFNKFNLPSKPTETPITIGYINFVINSSTRIKKPSYKTAVIGMEGHLQGISFLLSQGRTITGVVKKGRSTFIRTDKLLKDYDIIIGGVLDLEVVQDIDYGIEGKLADDGAPNKVLAVDPSKASELSEANAVRYIRLDRIEPNLVGYVKAYEKKLMKGQKKTKKTKAVTSRSAYTTTKGKSKGPDWAYVVKTLVTVPTEKESIGELNVLADDSITKAEKERRFPWYKLEYGEPWGTRKLYVSIESVDKRIQDLKGAKSIEADRPKVEPKEIV